MTKDEALMMAIEAMCDFDYDKRLEAIKFCKKALEQPAQEPKCSNHPDAPHGFCRDASHSADRYVFECEGWEAEQPAQEPVAWMNEDELPDSYPYDEMFKYSEIVYGVRMFPVFQPAPSWQGLSDDELNEIVDRLDVSLILDCSISDFVGAIEAKLKEKNHG